MKITTNSMDKVNSIDEYISIQDKNLIPKLNSIRKTIKKFAPVATEKISYGMPTFHYKENIIHFAAYKNHIGIYPTPSAINNFSNELKGYKTSKGAIQIPNDMELDLDLIANLVLYRLNEIELKKK